MFLVLIYKSDIVPVILCGRKICSVKSIEEMRMKVIESRLVRRIFDVCGRQEQRDVEDCVVIFMTVALQQILM